MNKILLLEDDPILAKTVKRFLLKNGYEVDLVQDGEEALEATYKQQYALYLLDINVPLLNGDDMLLLLRESGDTTPSILISALVDIESQTKGFASGADDYIKKPFDPQELLLRIKAKTHQLKKNIHYKEYELLIDEQKILKNSKELSLSQTQKNIFISLLQNYPNPVTKEELMLFLESPTDLALRVNITKLKQKLELSLENVRGVGYKLT